MVLPGKDIVFPQGESFPVVGAQDSAKIRVARKINPQQVERLSFMPVCCGPEIADGGYRRLLSGSENFYGERMVQIETPQVIDRGHFVIRCVVHPAEIRQPVHLELRIPKQKLRHFPPVLGLHLHPRVFIPRVALADSFPKHLS